MAGIALPGAALGQEDVHPLLTSKVWLSLGAYFPRHSLDIQANLTPASPGFGVDPGFNVPIDIEKDWGVSDSEDLLMAELGWQFGDKWGIGLQYFQSERSNSLALDDTIEWEEAAHKCGLSSDCQPQKPPVPIVESRHTSNWADYEA